MLRLTNGLHPSKKFLGYFYTKSKGVFIAYCGNIKLQEYKTKSDCINSFKNRQ